MSQGFFSPLSSGTRKQIIFWISIIVLLTLKIYEGDQKFFVAHFGEAFEEGPLLDWYKWTYHHLATLLLLALIPMALVKLSFKEKLIDYGWQLGDWKFGLKATLVSFSIMILPVYLSSQNPEHAAFYPLTTMATASVSMFAIWGLCYLPHYIGWEFFFRGYIGLGLKDKLGVVAAIGIQTVLTTLMHIGKPEGETWGAAFGGIYLGLLTYRTGSVFWAILFHFYLGMLNTYFCG